MRFIVFILLLIPALFLNAIASPNLMTGMKFLYYIGIIISALSCAYAEPLLKLRFRFENFFSVRNARDVEFREGFIKFTKVMSFISYLILIGVIMYRASKGI